MITRAIVYDGVPSFRTQFDDVDRKIHNLMMLTARYTMDDLALERPTHAQGGDKGEDAVTSRHGGRFD